MSFHIRGSITRRSVTRRLFAAIVGGGAALAATSDLPSIAQAVDYTVLNTNDSGAGSLRQAIIDANAAGAGNHTITLDSSLNGNTLTLADKLDDIQVNIVINGGGATLSGHNDHRLFFIAAGNVTIRNFTLQDGSAQGGNGGGTEMAGGGGGGLGAGGAIFVNSGANVTVEGVTFSGNGATGGAGGIASGNFGHSAGGGGGGLHGNGGNGGGTDISGGGGGGGGGYYGNGGSGDSGRAGAGGGGILLDGGNATSPIPGAGALAGGDGGFNTFNGGSALLPGGGGGGGGSNNNGGAGAEFGGGGGGGYGGDGGAAGFGGGGGGSGFVGNEGTAGFGGGTGGATYVGGSGGSAFGGAIFVRSGGSLTVVDSVLANGTTSAGNGGFGAAVNGNNGDAAGTGVYLMNGMTMNFVVSTTAGSITLSDTISGDGAFRKQGDGELVLTGSNNYLGGTEVAAGRLAVNGTLEGVVYITGTGNLGGTGSINGGIFNDGVVSPGNSIGTLTMTGDFTQNAAGTLEIEINAAGQSDVLNVIGNVDLQGALNVKAEAGNYVANTQYTFLTFSGNRTGTFSSIYDDLAFFDILLQYNAFDVSFLLQANSTNFAAIADTFNQRSVAVVVDANSSGALQPLADEMLLMTNSQVQYSLDQLSGYVYGTAVQMQFQNTSNQVQMLASHLQSLSNPGSDSGGGDDYLMPVSYDRKSGEIVFACRSHGRPSSSTWVNSYGLGGSAQGNANTAGLGYGQGGLQLGVDHWFDDDTLAGLYGGYNYARFDLDGLTQRVAANSGQVGSYYRRNFGSRHLLLAGGFGFDAYDSSRGIAINNINSTAFGDYDGWQSVAYSEYGRDFQTRLGKLQPYGAMQYIYLRQNSFSETGGGIANLDVAGVDAESLRSILGFRLDREVRTGRGAVLVPQIRTGWLHEFLDTDTVMSNRFAAVPGTSFAAQGLDLGRDWALLGAGLGWRMTDQLTLTSNYDAQLNANQTFHVGSANLQYVW